MKSLFIILITFMNLNTFAETCPRDLERLNRNQLFELKSMDNLVGSYMLSGNEFCKKLTIVSNEVCNPSESDKSLATTYYLTVEGDGAHPVTSFLRYSIQPESRISGSYLSVGNKKVSLQNNRGSHGGITSSTAKVIMNFNKKTRQLNSVDIIETEGVFVQHETFSTHCEASKK